MYKAIFLFFFCTILAFNADTKSKSRQLQIVIIDSGYSGDSESLCKGKVHFNGFTGEYSEEPPADDEIRHGTNVLNTVEENTTASYGSYCFIVYKIFDKGKEGFEQTKALYRAYIALLKASPSPAAVNMSYASGSEEYNIFTMVERSVIMKLRNTKFFVAAGNEGIDMDKEGCKIYPACFGLTLKNVFTVMGVMDKDVKLLFPASNRARWIKYKAPFCNSDFSFCGTSHAAPYFLGKSLKDKAP